jgi:hypothetical protein
VVVGDEEEQAERYLITVSNITGTHNWHLIMLRESSGRYEVRRLPEKSLVALRMREGPQWLSVSSHRL